MYPPVLAGSGQAACDRTCFLQAQAAPGRARQGGRDPLVSVSQPVLSLTASQEQVTISHTDTQTTQGVNLWIKT